MSNPQTSAPSRSGGLSLYANLLDPPSGAATSISRAPVVFKQPQDSAPEDDASAKKPTINAAALKFQPVRRQQPPQKTKPKSTFSKLSAIQSNPTTPAAPQDVLRPQKKSTLADWTAAGDDDDVNGFYGGEKRQRGGRKRRKKNKEDHAVAQDWDDIYDPSRPNNYDEYRHSDEKIREIQEWKDRLYARRRARQDSSDEDSHDADAQRPHMSNQFAPPSGYSFAPPPIQPPPPAQVFDDATGDEAYIRRLQMNQGVPPPPPPPSDIPSPPKAAIALPTTTQAGVISRAPVRYNFPAAPSELPASEAELEKALAEEPASDAEEDADDTPRSLRPGQKGFAERLMSKYGWSKGTGLGADGSGIINPLRVQLEKRRKKPDSEGGGFADPKGVGKIIGGKKKDPGADVGKFGAMAEVVVLRGMVDGMDLDAEVGDGDLMQEIGEECGEKYGNVERVYIDRQSSSAANVYVKFTSQLSALRAVNALEGRNFNGNTISAMFYSTEKFEDGVYE